MTALLNVGLDVGDKRDALSTLDVLRALRWIGADALRGSLVESDTERTFVVEVKQRLTPTALWVLADALRQDAIAQWDGLRGRLEGPRADRWGPFNPAFFFTLDGARLAEPAAAIAA